jgi:hypothetical protein
MLAEQWQQYVRVEQQELWVVPLEEAQHQQYGVMVQQADHLQATEGQPPELQHIQQQQELRHQLR